MALPYRRGMHHLDIVLLILPFFILPLPKFSFSFHWCLHYKNPGNHLATEKSSLEKGNKLPVQRSEFSLEYIVLSGHFYSVTLSFWWGLVVPENRWVVLIYTTFLFLAHYYLGCTYFRFCIFITTSNSSHHSWFPQLLE